MYGILYSMFLFIIAYYFPFVSHIKTTKSTCKILTSNAPATNGTKETEKEREEIRRIPKQKTTYQITYFISKEN